MALAFYTELLLAAGAARHIKPNPERQSWQIIGYYV